MSKMIDKVIKFTIQADSLEDAIKQVEEEKGVKKIITSELTTQIFEIVALQEWYGEHNLGYCRHCGTDLCCRAEFISESCEECM